MIISDNGSNFKLAAKELKSLSIFIRSIENDDEITSFLANKSIEWRFNLERAPWWGGFFERLIKSLKICLKKCFGRALLTADELRCYVIQCESVINSRPLTYVPSNDDNDMILTPAHFLIGRRLTALPTRFDIRCASQLSIDLPNLHNAIRRMKNVFWNSWRRTYITSLREHYASKRKSRQSKFIEQGDVVVVEDNRVPRLLWKLGVVEHLITSRDGACRAARIATLTPGGKRTILNRSPSMLYPLELQTN